MAQAQKCRLRESLLHAQQSCRKYLPVNRMDAFCATQPWDWVRHNCSDATKHNLIKSDHFKMAHTNIDWKIAHCVHNNRVERICLLIEWVRLRHSTVRVSRNCSVKQCLCGWSFCMSGMRITMRNVHICECHLVLHSSPSYHFTMFKNDLVCIDH